MGMDPLVSWLGWWAMRGKHLPTLSTADAEHLHLGYFLREAEIWWRRSGMAVRASFKQEFDALESRAKAIAKDLESWWTKETADIVSDCQRLVREFAAKPVPQQNNKTYPVHRIFEAAVAQPSWENHKAWSNAGKWTRSVGAAIQAFGRTPLEIAPTRVLPFDVLALPQFARSTRFVVAAMAAGVGVMETLGVAETDLHANLAKAAESLDGPVSGAVAFSLPVVAGRLAAKLPRTFHEFCMDLAASAAPALQVLDLLFAKPSGARLNEAVEWTMFAAWDWSALGGIQEVRGNHFDAAQFENPDGLSGWLRYSGLLSSKDAHPLAAMASSAMNALSLHLASGGFAALGATGKQPADKQSEAPVPSTAAANISIKVGMPTKQGHQVNVPLQVDSSTRDVKARVADLLEELGTTGKASAIDNRTVADLLAACPELEAMLTKAKSGVRGKSNIEAPALMGRVAKR